MKTVTIKINFGGFIGADEELQFDVPDDYNEDDIDEVAQEKYEEYVLENSTWEITDVTDEEEETW